jgi:ATP-dependent DNA helicase DinG
MTSSMPIEDRAEKVLERAVILGVGSPDARPRPGQLAATRDVATIQTKIGDGPSGRGHLAGQAGVGIGKSYVGLTNAGLRASLYGERTLFSTKSLPLQAQIVDKDAPVVSQAVADETGKGFTAAVLKGWGNYVCGNRAYELASALIGEDVFGFPGQSTIKPLMARVRKLPDDGTIKIEGGTVDLAEVKPLVLWSLQQMLDDGTSGDKDTYDGEASDDAWKAVSVSPEECVGLDECPFAEFCKSDRARTRAAEADVVVTNHSILAVQASIGVPVILGNSTLGRFDHIIVDEAHELPKTVRSQGECSVSGRRMSGLIRLVRAVANDSDSRVSTWIEQGHQIAELVENELHGIFTERSSGEVSRLTDTDDPLARTGEGVIAWARVASRLIKKPVLDAQKSGRNNLVMAGRRATGGIDSLIADVTAVRKHKNGQARWLQAPPKATPVIGRRRPIKPWYAVQAAPVEVGGLLRGNLWTQTVEDEETGDVMDISPSVTCMSGTLPPGFAMDAGLNVRQNVEYELPFQAAYAQSMLYIPSAKGTDDVLDLTVEGFGGRRRFSTDKHADWALKQMYELVDANGGHALVLAAKGDTGKKYAQALRAHAAGRWNVYSQWDAGAPRLTLAKWKADTTGVLVGTQGLMTGVDAPGETCSLVILDRPPRAAANPVDDARVELIVERLGGGKAAEWTARRLVYVADSIELMGQARGRLIRGENDRGVFAVLEPRMLKNHVFTYEETARRDMMKTVDVYGQKTSELSAVTAFMRDRQKRRDLGLAA